jgi:hypothetical protein
MIFAHHEYHAIDLREESTGGSFKDCSFGQFRGANWLDYLAILDTFSSQSHCLYGRKPGATRQH